MKVCAEPGCPVLLESGRTYCPKHHTQHRQHRPPDQRERGPRVYDKKWWKRLRKAVLSEKPLCEHCDRPRRATEVDHIDGDETNRERSNLQSLCKPCHSRKTALCDGSFGREKKQPERSEQEGFSFV